MTSRSEQLNGGAYSRTALATLNHTAVAGGTGDATQVDTAWFDREVAEPHMGLAMSAKLSLAYSAVLGFGESGTFAVQFQDADTIGGSGAANYGEAYPATVFATGESGGSTEADTAEIDVGLEGARRFIRARITPNLSRAITDTLAWQGQWVLFGFHQSVVTKSTVSIATP